MINRVESTTKWIIESKTFFWSAISSMAVVTSISIILYICNAYEINGYLANELDTATGIELTRIISRIVLTPLGATFASLSLLLINRHNKNFIYFALPSTIMLTLNSLISQLLFDSIKWLCVGTILFTQAVIWHKKSDEGHKFHNISTMYVIIIGLVLLIVGLLVGVFGVSNIPESSLFYNKKPILDPIQFMFTIAGNIMMMMFIVQSRLIYLVGNILTFTMFLLIVMSGDLLSLILLMQSILYMTMTICGYINMRLHKEEEIE